MSITKPLEHVACGHRLVFRPWINGAGRISVYTPEGVDLVEHNGGKAVMRDMALELGLSSSGYLYDASGNRGVNADGQLRTYDYAVVIMGGVHGYEHTIAWSDVPPASVEKHRPNPSGPKSPALPSAPKRKIKRGRGSY